MVTAALKSYNLNRLKNEITQCPVLPDCEAGNELISWNAARLYLFDARTGRA